jgi:tRNA (guanine9-N1)-methyltransferase
LTSEYHIAFDLEYEKLMNTKNLKSLTSQLSHSYSLNKKVDVPFAFHFCSYRGELKQYLEDMGCANWFIHKYEKSLPEIEEFTKYDLVYLSPDSENILEEVNKNTVYIIGGLVDKPISRNQSLYRAKLFNIRTARLPLDEIIKNNNKSVLNVNTVIELLAGYIKHNDWEKAIIDVIPKRKLN